MSPTLYATWIMRESRGSRRRLAFFVACLAVGVAAIVSVAGLSSSMQQGIRAEARKLLGGDLEIDGRRPLPDQLGNIIGAQDVDLSVDGPVLRTDIREMATIAAAPPRDGQPGPSRLVELKVIDGVFPYYGELRLEPAQPLDQLLTEDSVVAAPDLLAALGLNIGDDMMIGGQAYRVAGAVHDEPDRLNFSFSIGPRVFMSNSGLARTSLLGRGSRVRYEALLKLPDGATAEDAHKFARYIEANLTDMAYYDVTTYDRAQPALRAGLRRITRFLGLVGLLSLLIGGLGVAQTVRAWIAARLDAIAVMRCLGLRPREVVALYAGQTALLGFVGSVLGAAIGIAVQMIIPHVISDLVPIEFINPWQPLAIARGVALGVGVALIFSVPPLISIRRIPPARVFRADSEPLGTNMWVQAIAGVILFGGIYAAAIVQGGSVEHGSYFTGGLLVVVAVLALFAWGMTRLVAKLPRDGGTFFLRHGLARLAQPGAATISSIVALGLGVMIVLAMHLVERHLTSELDGDLPENAPSSFLVDIQPDQWEGVKAILEREGGKHIDVVPVVTSRVRAIDGQTIDQLIASGRYRGRGRDGDRNSDDDARSRGSDGEQRGELWALTREQRLSYGPDMQDGNELREGEWFADPDLAEVSIEEEYAQELGVKLGSVITMDIQGVELDLHVTSLRYVDWRTFNVNFFMQVEPGILEEAPQVKIATAQLTSEGDNRVRDALAVTYPNVTLIRIRDMLEKVLVLLGRLAVAVQLLGGFTVIAGVVILGGAISAGYVRRGKEVALLKTLGMTRRDVITIFAVEYALVGLAAAVIGGVAGGVLAWSVVHFLFESTWDHRPIAYAAAALGAMLLAVGAGLAASSRALAARPIEVLRTQ